MTCVVGLERKGEVWLASDSFLGTDTAIGLTSGPKWFHLQDMTIGWAGDLRSAQVINHGLKLRSKRKKEDPTEYLVSIVARKFRDSLRDAGVVFKTTDGTESTNVEFLIVLEGRLFQMWGDCSVIHCSRGMGAIGLGGPYALGALSALLPLPLDVTPEKTLDRVLRLSQTLSPGVNGPFYVSKFT